MLTLRHDYKKMFSFIYGNIEWLMYQLKTRGYLKPLLGSGGRKDYRKRLRTSLKNEQHSIILESYTENVPNFWFKFDIGIIGFPMGIQ